MCINMIYAFIDFLYRKWNADGISKSQPFLLFYKNIKV